MTKYIFLSLFIISIGRIAQAQFDHVLMADSTSKPLQYPIEELAWIEGYWTGNAIGGEVEEIWSAPTGKSMMGSFKLVIDGETIFYELQIIKDIEGSPTYMLKHFNDDLSGWEETGSPEKSILLKVNEQTAYFDGFTFERIKNDLNIYVVFEKEGELQEVKFAYALNE